MKPLRGLSLTKYKKKQSTACDKYNPTEKQPANL